MRAVKMRAVKRRKQSIKFRPKYASSKAKEWSGRLARTLVGVGILAGVVGGGVAARHEWSNNETFKIREVVLQGDIPSGLEKSLPFDRTGNLLALRPARAQRAMLAAYSQLQSVSVRRTWSRAVVVTGHYRTPRAWFSRNGTTQFIDDTGTVFALAPGSVDLAHFPELACAHDSDRFGLLQCLIHWSARQPSFSSQITKCETDTIHRLRVTLADGTVVDWGEINAGVLDVRTHRVMRVMENYHPAKTPAHLLFVTDDRLVMDSMWRGN